MTIAEISRGDLKIEMDVTPEDLVRIINTAGGTGDVCIRVNGETLTLTSAIGRRGLHDSLKLMLARFFDIIDYWLCKVFGTFNL